MDGLPTWRGLACAWLLATAGCALVSDFDLEASAGAGGSSSTSAGGPSSGATSTSTSAGGGPGSTSSGEGAGTSSSAGGAGGGGPGGGGPGGGGAGGGCEALGTTEHCAACGHDCGEGVECLEVAGGFRCGVQGDGPDLGPAVLLLAADGGFLHGVSAAGDRDVITRVPTGVGWGTGDDGTFDCGATRFNAVATGLVARGGVAFIGAQSGTIFRLDPDGASPDERCRVASSSRANGMGLARDDPSKLFFTNPNAPTPTPGLYSIDVGGSFPVSASALEIEGSYAFARDLAVGPHWVVWANWDGAGSSRLVAYAIDDDSTRESAVLGVESHMVAALDDTFYARMGARLVRVDPASGSGPLDLVNLYLSPTAAAGSLVLADRAFLYFDEEVAGGRVLLRCPRTPAAEDTTPGSAAGCDELTTDAPRAIATDGTWVYFADQASAIRRVRAAP